MVWYILGAIIGVFILKKRFDLTFWSAVWYGVVLALGVYSALATILGLIIVVIGLEEPNPTLFSVLIGALVAFGAFRIMNKLLVVDGPNKHMEQSTSPFINEKTYSGSIGGYQVEPGDTIETRLAGVTFEERQKILRELHKGQEVIIIREPGNKFDSNAIKVTNHMINELVLGYIPKELAAKISKIIDEYQTEPIIGSVTSIYRLKNDPSILGVKVSFDLPDFPEDQLEEFDKDDLDYKIDDDYLYGDEEIEPLLDIELGETSNLGSDMSDKSTYENETVRVLYPKFKPARRG